MSTKKMDHWSAEKYQSAAGFVPQLTTKVVINLDVSKDDVILDIGCGDGILTTAIAQQANRVVGLDASPAMIRAAQALAAKKEQNNCIFKVADCSRLFDSNVSNQSPNLVAGGFNKVFSNAALHWILRNPSQRSTVFCAAYQALKPGGSFVFECGGAGNVAEVVTAMIAALIHVAHFTKDKARSLIPWYFADETWTKQELEKAGFEVKLVELEYRPTRLQDGEGIEGWLTLFGASILAELDKDTAARVVDYAAELLGWSIKREDGCQWIGYVRLRAVAIKR